jgi:hypothetical protein
MTAAPAVRFRQLVENALTHLSWFDTVHSHLGLTGVSQIWDEEPAWYFWLGGRSYLLRYANLAEAGPDELTAILHTFPSKEEWIEGVTPAFAHPLLTTEHFDFSTMTPRYESFSLFKDSFVAGEMTFSLAGGELQLLAASGYVREWSAVWRYLEFFVAMVTFQRKAEPWESPYFFSAEEEITSVLVPFDSSGSAMAKAIVTTESCRRLAMPLLWHRLAHEQFHCSVSGACACSHEH